MAQNGVTGNYAVTDRTKFKRIPARGTYDKKVVHAILDEARTCTVSYSINGNHFNLPQIFGRIGETLYLHGSVSSGFLKAMRTSGDICFSVTLVDGLVLARSGFHHSMNYRSCMVMGRAELVKDPEEKLAALDAIVSHIVPGRVEDLQRHDRPPTKAELASTAVLRLPMVEVSAKVRTGGPKDDKPDIENMQIWAGVVPLSQQQVLAPEASEDLQPGIPVPEYLKAH